MPNLFGDRLPGDGLIGRLVHLPKHVLTMGGGRGGQPQIKGRAREDEGDDDAAKAGPDPQAPLGGGRGDEP